jgi:hypothetical protein
MAGKVREEGLSLSTSGSAKEEPALSQNSSDRSDSKSKFSTKEKHLPPNFAERVLELEMEIDRDCSNIENVNTLLYLYSVRLD